MNIDNVILIALAPGIGILIILILFAIWKIRTRRAQDVVFSKEVQDIASTPIKFKDENNTLIKTKESNTSDSSSVTRRRRGSSSFHTEDFKPGDVYQGALLLKRNWLLGYGLRQFRMTRTELNEVFLYFAESEKALSISNYRNRLAITVASKVVTVPDSLDFVIYENPEESNRRFKLRAITRKDRDLFVGAIEEEKRKARVLTKYSL